MKPLLTQEAGPLKLRFEGLVRAVRKSCVAILLLVAPLVAHAQVFNESWESLPLGFVQPDELGRFDADMGTWLAGDTVSEFPECGPTPHTGEIIIKNGEKALRLTSNDSNSECADNLWIEFREFAPLNINPGFSIPLNSDSVLSFQETGSLVDPGPIGPATCVVRPCGDNISLVLQDPRGFELVYVLQRAPGQEPDNVPSPIAGIYKEIFLDPNAGSYSRNLLDDFGTIPGYGPNGASIGDIVFQINEHGTATIDKLKFDTVTPPARPDLIVAVISIDKTQLLVGDNATISATVRNQGTGSSAATTLRYVLSSDATITTSDTQIGVDSIALLGPGGQSIQSTVVSAPTSGGTFWIGACVDAVAGEIDSSNNCSQAVAITVAPKSISLPWLKLLLLDD